VFNTTATVIYARYSPGPHQTECSIEGQLKECYEYAKQNGLEIIEEYIDRALTGTNDNRLRFRQMISDSYQKHFQYVLVYQFDRFARDKYDSVHYKRVLKRNGVRVISSREHISDDASGILMESVLEGMAEYYSAELSQKITRGMDLNGEKGFSTGGNIALGYKTVPVNPNDENSKKIFVVDEKTAPLVRRIFQMYADGMNVTQITNQLNAEGYKTSRGVPFNKNSLRTMLQNKRYIGIYTYKGKEYPGKIPQIISDELFNKVTEIMNKNRKAPAIKKAKEEYLLTLKLFCGYCKEMMTGNKGTSKTKKSYRYYSCNGAKKKLCNKKGVRKEYIEDLVIKECYKLLTDKNIERIANKVVEVCKAGQDTTNLKSLKISLAENERKHKNLMDAIMECDIDSVRKSLYLEVSPLEEEHLRIEKEIALEQKNHPVLTISKVKFFLNQLKNGDINDIKYRKTLISVFVNQIYLYDDKITIIFNSGDKAVTINDLLLSEIEKEHKQNEFCLCSGVVDHQGLEPRTNRL
jgi:site-specific DNA recombinase